MPTLAVGGAVDVPLRGRLRYGLELARLASDLVPQPVSIGSLVLGAVPSVAQPGQACLDPAARHVEVQSSPTGMSVNRACCPLLAQILEEELRWTG